MQITLNNTKTTLVGFKTLTVCVDILDLHKQFPQVGLALVSCPCHVGQRQMLCVTLQGPGVDTCGTEHTDQSPRAEVLKMV